MQEQVRLGLAVVMVLCPFRAGGVAEAVLQP